MLVENCPAPLDKRIWTEATALRDAGFQVSIICPKEPTMNRESYTCLNGIYIYRYHFPKKISSKCNSYIWEYSIAMLMTFVLSVKVLVLHGFDVIHAANPPDLFFMIGLFYQFFGKIFVYDQHDLSPEMFQVKFRGKMKLLHKLLLFLEWCSYRTADVVITPNSALKRFAIVRGNCRADRVFIVRNLQSMERVKPVAPEPELKRGRRYLLAYVGVMGVQDGVDNTLYALHDLVHKRGRQDVSLVLIGDGECGPKLRMLAHELELDDYVHFNGWTSPEDVLRYLTVVDVGLSPDPENGYNEYCTMVKLMEYMAMGKPSVAFDLAETHLLAQDAALYAKPNSIEDFASNIETLLDDEERRIKMGSIGRKRIERELLGDQDRQNLLLAYKVLFPMSFELQQCEPVV